MIKNKYYIPAVSVLLLLGGLGFAWSDSGDLSGNLPTLKRLIPERGVVTFVEGGVDVRRAGSEWEPVYVGDRIGPEDTLRSSETGRTEVSWGTPRRVLRVERESIVALSGAPAGNRLVLVGARVDQGALWVKVAGKRLFTVASRDIVATLRAAKLALRLFPDSDRMAVYEGTAEVSGRTLGAGSGMVQGSDGNVTHFEVLADDDLRDGWRDIVKEALQERDPAAETFTQTRRLTKDLRDLNPEIYLGVEVELTGTATNASDFEAEAARIRKIKVKASRWDGMKSDTKVQLLNDTFSVLKDRYPSILETVVLEFDDNRPRLSLKYAAAG